MALLSTLPAFSQEGSRRFVAVESAEVRDSTGFFASTLGSFPLGTEVTVIRESGRWTEVRGRNLAGWVASTALSARRVVGSNSGLTANEVALAGKGFSQETEREFSRGEAGMQEAFSLVDEMERAAVQVAMQRGEFLRFIDEGQLARGE